MGEEKKFYTIEVQYTAQDNELKMFRGTNFNTDYVQKFREAVFINGFAAPLEEGVVDIVPPWQIKSIRITKQAHFFSKGPGTEKGQASPR